MEDYYKKWTFFSLPPHHTIRFVMIGKIKKQDSRRISCRNKLCKNIIFFQFQMKSPAILRRGGNFCLKLQTTTSQTWGGGIFRMESHTGRFGRFGLV